MVVCDRHPDPCQAVALDLGRAKEQLLAHAMWCDDLRTFPVVEWRQPQSGTYEAMLARGGRWLTPSIIAAKIEFRRGKR